MIQIKLKDGWICAGGGGGAVDARVCFVFFFFFFFFSSDHCIFTSSMRYPSYKRYVSLRALRRSCSGELCLVRCSNNIDNIFIPLIKSDELKSILKSLDPNKSIRNQSKNA